jgi:hypothetical protein
MTGVNPLAQNIEAPDPKKYPSLDTSFSQSNRRSTSSLQHAEGHSKDRSSREASCATVTREMGNQMAREAKDRTRAEQLWAQ